MRWTRPLCLLVLAVSTAGLARPINETPPSLPEPDAPAPAPELVPAEA